MQNYFKKIHYRMPARKQFSNTKQKISKLRNEQKEYAAILANIPLLIMIIDKKAHIEKVSYAVAKKLGKLKEEIIGMQIGQTLPCAHHRDHPQGCGFSSACQKCQIRQIIQNTFNTGKKYFRHEVIFSSFDKPLIQKNLLISSILIQTNNEDKVQIFIEDVTDHKNTEKILQEKERQQKALSEMGQMALSKTDLSKVLNKSVQLLKENLEVDFALILEFSYSKKSLVPKAGFGCHEADKSLYKKNSDTDFSVLYSQPDLIDKLTKNPQFTNFKILKKYGITSGISILVGSSDKPFGILGAYSKPYKEFSQRNILFVKTMANIITNIIERKKIETFLKENEEKYRLLFQQSPIGIIHTDKNGIVINVNDNYAKMIKATKDQLIGFDILKNLTNRKILNVFQKALKGTTGYFSGKIESVITGHSLYCNLIIKGLFDENNSLFGGIIIVEDLSSQANLQKSLQQSDFLLKQAQSVAGVGSWHLKIPSNILKWSDQTYVIFNMEKKEKVNFSIFIDHVHPDDKDNVKKAWEIALKNGSPYDVEHRIIVDNKVCWVHEKAIINFDSNGSPVEAIGTILDINERKKAEKTISDNEKKFRSLFESSRDAVVIMQREKFVDCNKAALKMFGCDSEEIFLGKQPTDFAPIFQSSGIDTETDAQNRINEALSTGSHFFECILKKYNGKEFPAEIMLSKVELNGEKMLQALVRDITERKNMEEELERLAATDPLTGALNRRRFLEKGEYELHRANRYNHPLAFLMLDIDHFKSVNDSYGHHTGDLVLKALVNTSMQEIRKIDIFGRLGGEEFSIILPETDYAGSLQTAQRLRISLSETKVKHEKGTIGFTVSIGVAILNNETDTIASLMARSDKALYKAKANGRNCVISMI